MAFENIQYQRTSHVSSNQDNTENAERYLSYQMLKIKRLVANNGIAH